LHFRSFLLVVASVPTTEMVVDTLPYRRRMRKAIRKRIAETAAVISVAE